MVTVFWTLGLLFLGSIVHATESSLACPDWPTCFGSMVPEMTGGVFWEHLHRLVAGGLVLMFALATWLVRKEATDRPWMFRAALAGIGLLVVQSIFGGITVIYELPSLVSTSHLTLAFVFASLATVLASSSAWRPSVRIDASRARRLERFATVAVGLVFAQSIVGGLVRHLDAGMSCPDAPLCLGQVIPPLINPLITVHFTHRVLGLVVLGAIVGLAVWASRADIPRSVRRWTAIAAWLAVAQVALGFASVLTVLAVAPVSLHTLLAVSLLVVLVHVATTARHMRERPEATRPTHVASADASAP
ncbi:MAG: COX15/CtaA family protein [Gemmatimonadota bacterium]